MERSLGDPAAGFAVAAYALLLLAGIKAYGGTTQLGVARAASVARASRSAFLCLDLVTALRRQLAARPELLADWHGAFDLAHAVEHAAA